MSIYRIYASPIPIIVNKNKSYYEKKMFYNIHGYNDNLYTKWIFTRL